MSIKNEDHKEHFLLFAEGRHRSIKLRFIKGGRYVDC